MIIDLRSEGKAGLREPLITGGVRVHACLFPDGKTHQIGSEPLNAFIDTGASRSCIPRTMCRGPNGLAIPRVVDIQNALDWRGDEAGRPVCVYEVWVTVFGSGPFRVRAYETGHPYFIVGRDLLAHFLTVLDGPAGKLGVPTTGKFDHFLRRCLRAP